MLTVGGVALNTYIYTFQDIGNLSEPCWLASANASGCASPPMHSLDRSLARSPVHKAVKRTCRMLYEPVKSNDICGWYDIGMFTVKRFVR